MRKFSKEKGMLKKGLIGGTSLLLSIFLFCHPSFSQEDKLAEIAISIFKTQVRLPQGTEIKFLEKKESPIPDFYSVQLLLVFPDKEVPAIIYVDKTGEKVILGNLFVKGENVTVREARPPIPQKADMGSLEIERSPFVGSSKGAKVTIVEFSNFECPFCLDSWLKIKELMDKYPADIRYIFKHFPFRTEGKAFELSEIAAAAQEVGQEAFWLVHDFLFTSEGQAVTNLDRKAVQLKIEQLLREKNHDVKAFVSALETGKAKKRVLEDMAVGNRIHVTGTPTKIMNGEIIVGSTPEDVVERYLRK